MCIGASQLIFEFSGLGNADEREKLGLALATLSVQAYEETFNLFIILDLGSDSSPSERRFCSPHSTTEVQSRHEHSADSAEHRGV